MFFNILCVFLWKHYKRLLYFWKTTLICIFLPLLLITLQFRIADTDPYTLNEEYSGDNSQYLKHQFHPISQENLLAPEFLSFSVDDRLYYAPNTTDSIQNLMETARLKLGMLDECVVGFQTVKELYSDPLFLNGTSSINIIFEKTDISKELDYTIRIKSNDFNTENIYFDSVLESVYTNVYIHNGFIAVQYAIESSYMELKTNNTDLPEISVLHAPVKYVKAPHGLDIDQFQSITFFSFLLLFATLVLTPMVEEKQDGIKEILSIATTYSYFNQVALFLQSFGICTLLMLILIGESIYYNLFQCINIVFPFILMLFFCCCMISYTFFISSFFDSVNFAVIVGVLFYIIPIFVFKIAKSPVILFFKFLSPSAVYENGMNIFNRFLSSQRCFELEDMFSKEHPVQGYSLFEVYLSLIGTSFLYLFLYYYISNVMPGKSGTPRPFYFLCLPSFWRKPDEEPTATPLSFIQTESSRNSFVRICELTKVFRRFPVFGSNFTAVDNISFALPENHITILLGHNGAGKTTTMSMITGITPPSHGKIYVGNESDVNEYRSKIGYCPQHDVFISYMNCKDHLLFFGRLRGLSADDAENEANIILEKVKLNKFGKKAAKTLSSGMKRRLCLACAVIGQTKLVILDEPSTGLDPESRRDLWDVLLPLRKERTILLTTHSMEEADVLGDKIVIMDHGNVICEGTQFQLKKRFGTGYTLKILMGIHFNKDETLNIITKCIPGAFEKSHIHPTLMIGLPFNSIDSYSSTLEQLEQNKSVLGIESISMANTTMEEVFLNSASKADDPRFGKDEIDSKYMRLEDQHKIEAVMFVNQILAIFYKKTIFIKRSWLKFLIQAVLPVIGILAAYYTQLGLQMLVNNKVDYKSLNISANHIKSPEVLLFIDSDVPDYTKILSIFNNIAQNENFKLNIYNDTGLNTTMDQIEKNNITRYYEQILTAMEIRKSYDLNGFKINCVYNGNIRYSLAYGINLASNFWVKYDTDSNDNKIHVMNSPLQKVGAPMELSYVYVHTIPIYFGFGFFFYILFYVNLPHIEETTEFKIIQNIPSFLYWGTTYFYDIIIHTLLTIIYISAISLCDLSNKLDNKHLGYILMTICIVGYTYIAILYILAKSFVKISSIYSINVYLMFISSMAALILSDPHFVLDYPFWYSLLRTLPSYSLQVYLFNIVTIASTKEEFDPEGFLVTAFLEIAICLIIVVFIFENIYVLTRVRKFMARLNPKNWGKKNIITEETLIEDPYVQTEAGIVNSAINDKRIHQYTLLVSALEKYYNDFHAVKGINFTVEKGECFGLLGMNGAGKSTTFKMMTLNSSITEGDIYINGLHCKTQSSQYQKQFGYCPEVNALLDFMTSYEILKYMALVKGTPSSQIEVEAKYWLNKMDLYKYRNVIVSQYSGGTKRKLSTAVSMISNPDLIFLDEPTSGVDPISRRFMWNCIKEFQINLKTIILTSHSMDECEELCNRLAIMTLGQFKCIGVIQRLKLIFGTGFTLSIKTKEKALLEDKKQMKLEVAQMFRCTLRDEYAETLIYNVLETDIKWSEIFEKIKKLCNKHGSVVEDFAINEISLEDIFLKFRNEQLENGIEILSTLVDNI